MPHHNLLTTFAQLGFTGNGHYQTPANTLVIQLTFDVAPGTKLGFDEIGDVSTFKEWYGLGRIYTAFLSSPTHLNFIERIRPHITFLTIDYGAILGDVPNVHPLLVYFNLQPGVTLTITSMG